jgi:prepilin-type processing-associated H-X9-DG protein
MNHVVPMDAGSVQVASDLAYGPDPRQRYDVYAPAGSTNLRPVPPMMFLYGGSWRHGDKANYAFVGRAFAARGFVVAIPDYRVVPDVHYPTFVVDCAKALAAFKATAPAHGGRPGPVYVAGHSAGAYNAVMLGLAEELLAPAGLTFDDIGGIAGLSGPYDFLPLRVSATRNAFGAVADLPATQPVNRAHANAPPMLLINGGDDDVVVPANIYRLQAELEAAGSVAVVKEYEDLAHVGPLITIARPLRQHSDVLDEVADFFHAVENGTPLPRRSAER